MQSKRFGVAWILHQTVPRFLDDNERRLPLRESAAVLAYAPADVMPCMYCRRSYRDFALKANIQQRLQSRATITTVKDNIQQRLQSRATVTTVNEQGLQGRLAQGNNGQKVKGKGRAAEEKGKESEEVLEKERAGGEEGLQRSDHEQYWFDVHNLVNRKLDKPILKPGDKENDYKVARNAREFLSATLDWLHMLSLNYRDLLTSGDSEAMRTRIKKALRLARNAASLDENAGILFALAQQNNATLGSTIVAFADHLYDQEICQCKSLAIEEEGKTRLPEEEFACSLFVSLTRNQWRKTVWYIFYLAHLARILENSKLWSDELSACAQALRLYLGLLRLQKERKEKEEKDAFLSQETLFEALYQTHLGCMSDTCPPRENLRMHYEMYKAGRCAGGTCV